MDTISQDCTDSILGYTIPSTNSSLRRNVASVNAVVDRIQSELDRISSALTDPTTSPEKWSLLHSAQQALAWALDPDVAASPFESIEDNAHFYPH